MENENDNRGIIFFYLFPVGLGIAYGIFNEGLTGLAWWLEAFMACVLLALAHILFKSWLFVGNRVEHEKRHTSPSLLWFFGLACLSDAVLIFVPVFIIFIIRWILFYFT